MLRAYKNDPKVKKNVMARVRRHRAADEIIKGKYWEEGKGCAVGCTIHSDDHSKYPSQLGIPTVLAYAEDTLFEQMPNEAAKNWPVQFLAAIKPGADLSLVFPKLALWLLVQAPFNYMKQTPEKADKTNELAAMIAAKIMGVPVSPTKQDAFVSESPGHTLNLLFLAVFRKTGARGGLGVTDIANTPIKAKKTAEKLLELLKEAK